MKSKGAAGLDSVLVLFLVGICSLVVFNSFYGIIDWKVKDIGCMMGGNVDPKTGMPWDVKVTNYPVTPTTSANRETLYQYDPLPGSYADYEKNYPQPPAGCESRSEGDLRQDPQNPDIVYVPVLFACPSTSYEYTVYGAPPPGNNPNIKTDTGNNSDPIYKVTTNKPPVLGANVKRGASPDGQCVYYNSDSPRPKPRLTNHWSVPQLPYMGCNTGGTGVNG